LIEHAIELDPRRVPKSLARGLAAAGVNRASLGVQDFSPHVQEAIGRPQPFNMVQGAVDTLREAGIANINIDLMYGLPKQTLADVARSAQLAASLDPARLALFGYAHVPWFKTHQKLIDTAALPGAAERIEQAKVAAQSLAAEGYAAIGLDHFARPDDTLALAQRAGRLHRNFQGYTTDEADALIGLGASSIGKLPQGFAQNAVDIASYTRAVEKKEFATIKGLALSDDDRMRARIIERLMCDLAVDLAGEAPGADFASELEQLASLVDAGMVTREGTRLTVTEQGRPFVRLVAAAFDAYLPQNRSRHSIAV
jgi:oxygen-independent coproporphyrinogen-3 oxidase